MDAIQTKNVIVPNSLLVGGLIDDEVDNEVFDYLAQFGAIERIIKIVSSEPQLKDSAIVELKSGETIQFLQDTLPDKRPSSNPNVSHHIQLLSDVYSADRGSSLTRNYLAELKGVAKLSGADFEKVLLDELARIQESTKIPQTAEPDTSKVSISYAAPAEPTANQTQTPFKITTDLTNSNEHDSLSLPVGAEALPLPKKPSLYLPFEHLITPEVQKVVVEHVIKNSNSTSHYHSSTKLRPFSGKLPCPNFESDYDTWRSNVEFHLADNGMSDMLTVRKMVESLLPPASNIIKHLGPNSTPKDYLSLLDSAYDIVDDGDELFAKLLSTNQNSGEKPSSYLQRLQADLSKVIKRGGISANDSERQLLKQFCRGCWNNSLITTLQLEQKKDNPLSFTELLLLLRTEEDRQAAKSSRMKQHFGFSKTKVQSNSLSVEDYSPDDTDMEATAAVAPPIHTNKLEKQLAKLQAQMASLKASLSNGSGQSSDKSNKKSKSYTKTPTEQKSPNLAELHFTKKPRPGYCFKCGEDGHIAPSCSNEPNPEQVDMKRKEFKRKQQAWEEQNRHNLN